MIFETINKQKRRGFTRRIRRGYNRYGAWYGQPYGPWDAKFIAFCLHYAGVEGIPYDADTAQWLETLTEEGVEQAIIRDLRTLPPQERKIIEECLREYYLIPKVTKITDSREKYGVVTLGLMFCFICGKIDYNMARYYDTFFMLTKDAEFRQKVENSKGFCMRHFLALMEVAPDQVPNSQQEWFYTTVFSLMRENMARVKDDLDWFIEKFDYRNASADWRNSRDAVSRSMQKLQGVYPADPPYKSEPR